MEPTRAFTLCADSNAAASALEREEVDNRGLRLSLKTESVRRSSLQGEELHETLGGTSGSLWRRAGELLTSESRHGISVASSSDSYTSRRWHSHCNVDTESSQSFGSSAATLDCSLPWHAVLLSARPVTAVPPLNFGTSRAGDAVPQAIERTRRLGSNGANEVSLRPLSLAHSGEVGSSSTLSTDPFGACAPPFAPLADAAEGAAAAAAAAAEASETVAAPEAASPAPEAAEAAAPEAEAAAAAPAAAKTTWAPAAAPEAALDDVPVRAEEPPCSSERVLEALAAQAASRHARESAAESQRSLKAAVLRAQASNGRAASFLETLTASVAETIARARAQAGMPTEANTPLPTAPPAGTAPGTAPSPLVPLPASALRSPQRSSMVPSAHYGVPSAHHDAPSAHHDAPSALRSSLVPSLMMPPTSFVSPNRSPAATRHQQPLAPLAPLTPSRRVMSDGCRRSPDSVVANAEWLPPMAFLGSEAGRRSSSSGGSSSCGSDSAHDSAHASASPPLGTALLPGEYYLDGVNVDTEQFHEYTTSGRCTLHADGTLSGEAQETSTAWETRLKYQLTHGHWAPEGHLCFRLQHADHRAAYFDPFYFSVQFQPALPRALTTARYRGEDSRTSSTISSISSITRRASSTIEQRRGEGGPDAKLGTAPKLGTGAKDDEAAAAAEEVEEEAVVWMAVAGWWKTYDGTIAPPARAAPGGAALPWQGSYGRLKRMRLVRVGAAARA